MDFDQIDTQIIKLLQRDGRMSYLSIAQQIGVSETTIRKRVQALNQNEVFQIVAVCDPTKLGFTIAGNLEILIEPNYSQFVLGELMQIKELYYLAITIGSQDLEIEFMVKSFQEMRNLIFNKIYTIKGIIRVESSIVVEYIKRTYEWGTSRDHPTTLLPYSEEEGVETEQIRDGSALEIDRTDTEIIRYLQADGRQSFKSIAKKIGVSETTISNRVQLLIEKKVFQITAVCNPLKLGFSIPGILKVRLDPQKAEDAIAELKKLEPIWFISLTTGAHDLDIEFFVESLQEMQDLIFNKIYSIKGVAKAESSIIMKYLKRSYEWGT